MEGHFGTLWRADVHVFEIADGGALGLGVTHHHPHIVLTALNALRFGAVKGAAHLGGQIVEGNAQAAGLRQQGEFDLLLAGTERIGDVEHTIVACQFAAQIGGSAHGSRPRRDATVRS